MGESINPDFMTEIMDRLCSNCGLTWGAHRASDGRCPGHQGWMDWDKGPGTTFTFANEVAEVERGTLARSLISHSEAF